MNIFVIFDYYYIIVRFFMYLNKIWMDMACEKMQNVQSIYIDIFLERWIFLGLIIDINLYLTEKI